MPAVSTVESELYVLFDRSPIGIYRSTADGTFDYVNPALARLLGYTVDELRTKNLNRDIYVDPELRSKLIAKYIGKGAIILSGTFRMTNQEELCVNVSGSNCDLNATWDPNTAGLFIFADGDFATDRAVQATPCSGCTGESIDMKKAQFQGGLFGAKDVFGNVTGTVLVGPIVSAYGSVAAGQSGVLSFPPIQFPSSGTDGFTGPLPVARLLAPRQFGGS